jgi:hypothetical protein
VDVPEARSTRDYVYHSTDLVFLQVEIGLGQLHLASVRRNAPDPLFRCESPYTFSARFDAKTTGTPKALTK